MCLCLGSWLWGWISRGHIGAFGLVMAFSFPSFLFRALWFGLALSFDWSFPLRVLCHNCIFVLHIFNKLMRNKNKRKLSVFRNFSSFLHLARMFYIIYIKKIFDRTKNE